MLVVYLKDKDYQVGPSHLSLLPSHLDGRGWWGMIVSLIANDHGDGDDDAANIPQAERLLRELVGKGYPLANYSLAVHLTQTQGDQVREGDTTPLVLLFLLPCPTSHMKARTLLPVIKECMADGFFVITMHGVHT